MVVKERTLYKQIAQYLQLQYPGAIYRFDLAADMKLTAGQASRHKALHPHRGYPDLFIAAGRGYFVKRGDKPPMFGNFICTNGDMDLYICNGMFLELKRDGTRILKKDGTLVADQHIREQHALLVELEKCGYAARFAVGFDQAKQIIDEYLGGPKEEVVEF